MKKMIMVIGFLFIDSYSSTPVWEKKFDGDFLLGKSHYNYSLNSSANWSPIWICDIENLKSGIEKYYAVQTDSVTANVYKIETGELETSLKIPFPRQDFHLIFQNKDLRTHPDQDWNGYPDPILIKGFTHLGNGWASIIMEKINPQLAAAGPLVVSDASGTEILRTDTTFDASLYYTGTSSFLLVEPLIGGTFSSNSTKVYKLADGLASKNFPHPSKSFIAKNPTGRKANYTTNGRIAKQAAKVLMTYLK